MRKRCGVCGQELSGVDRTCPNCGNNNFVSITIEDDVNTFDQIKGGVKGKGSKRAKMEFKVEWEFFREKSEWRFVERFINRIKNLYEEVVKDKGGAIIKRCYEPLTKHKGHGYAKGKKP